MIKSRKGNDMLNSLTKLFPQKTVAEQMKEFDQQYTFARMVAGAYLMVWFEQIFASSQFQDTFGDQPEIYKVLAAQVNNHLFAEEVKSYSDSDLSKETIEQIEQVLPHVAKWADDAMTQDPDLRELVVQTLRMEAIIEQLKYGVTDYLKTKKGARVAKLLHDYGGQVTTTPDSKSYSQLLKKWMTWQEQVGNRKIANV